MKFLSFILLLLFLSSCSSTSTKNQKLYTEASTRFSRGVHPSQAILGSQRGIELMRQLGPLG